MNLKLETDGVTSSPIKAKAMKVGTKRVPKKDTLAERLQLAFTILSLLVLVVTTAIKIYKAIKAGGNEWADFRQSKTFNRATIGVKKDRLKAELDRLEEQMQ